ncbi:hypothetical protein T492DRAFT_837134 [Pavlovales sp. CCMP2436]|nr:hypothetical protein T492DRAFT_837134 [Pavlovales sp. CCMP2436]
MADSQGGVYAEMTPRGDRHASIPKQEKKKQQPPPRRAGAALGKADSLGPVALPLESVDSLGPVALPLESVPSQKLAVPNSTKGMSPLATCATWLVTTWLVVTAAARSPPQTICCGRATSHGGERPLDLPVSARELAWRLELSLVCLFMINMDDAPTALRIMHARVCPLLAADVCAHRVSAVTPAMAAKAGFASMARDIEEGGCKGGARMAQIEVAISLSHLFGASLARERYPNASAVMFMEWPSARGGLATFAGALPLGWAHAQLQGHAEPKQLRHLRQKWKFEGRPQALSAMAGEKQTERTHGGCASSHCCTEHQNFGAGAYLLSASGLAQLGSWWQLGSTTSLVSTVEPRACWSLPEKSCFVTGKNLTGSEDMGLSSTPELNLAGFPLKLQPQLLADVRTAAHSCRGTGAFCCAAAARHEQA